MPDSFLYPWKSMRYSDDVSNELQSINVFKKESIEGSTIKEVTTFLNVINETLDKHNCGFFKDYISTYNNYKILSNPCFLLAELYQPDLLESNSKSLIYDQANLCSESECEDLLIKYYDIVNILYEEYKYLLSLNRSWYFQPKIYYKKYEDPNASQFAKSNGNIFIKKERVDSLSENQIVSNNDIENLIEKYSELLKNLFFFKFKYSYFLFIPIGLNKLPNKSHSEKLIGACFLHFGFNQEIYNEEIVFGELFQNINTYINSFYTSESFEIRKIELQTQATRAAISQVMARNMSHNIGSHVMSKFKDIKDFNFDYNSNDNQYIGLKVK